MMCMIWMIDVDYCCTPKFALPYFSKKHFKKNSQVQPDASYSGVLSPIYLR